MTARESGSRGEAIACAYLERRGMKLVERNFRMGRYEIDLVMREGETLVFVEVKSRRRNDTIAGREAVDHTKQRHIILAAAGYMQRHKLADAPARFDVAEVDLTTGGVVHIPAAFTC